MSSAALGDANAQRSPFRFGRLTKVEVVKAIEKLEEALEQQRLLDAAGQKNSFEQALQTYESMLGEDFHFRSLQRKGIAALALDGAGLVLVRRTGDGKSFVFWGAAQLRGGLSLQVAPLNVIIMSHAAAARAAGVRVVCITEGAVRGAPDGERSRDPGYGGDDAGMAALEGELRAFEQSGQMPAPICVLLHPEAAVLPRMLGFLYTCILTMHWSQQHGSGRDNAARWRRLRLVVWLV